MEQTVYKIGEVSARLGLVDRNNNTLRSWAEEFKEFLSALANPAAGQPRRFTRRDVQVLTAVRSYRANHMSYDEIRERLRAGEHTVALPASEDTAPQEDGLRVGPREQEPTLPIEVETLLAPLTASLEAWRRLAEDYRTRLEGREARIEALERRIEELYARLDGVRPAAAPDTFAMSGDAARHAEGVRPAAHDSAGGRTSRAQDEVSPERAAQPLPPDAPSVLFPLAVVEPATPEPTTPEPTTPGPATPGPATLEPATPEPALPGRSTASAPRRRWWQLWT